VHVDVVSTREDAAELAASSIAVHIRDAVATRGLATLALSGGTTPGAMVEQLASYELPWAAVHLFQVDERFVEASDPARNWPTLAPLVRRLPEENRHPMPVDGVDPYDDRSAAGAADGYASTLLQVCGPAPVLDVVHLGLGDDGHTASLTPGDSAVEVTDRLVAITQPYRGHRRLTLTMPVLDRAGLIVWLVTGVGKVNAVHGLVHADQRLVASHVSRARATLVVDEAAAARLGSGRSD
jgi:6-phosphogluconolactonase